MSQLDEKQKKVLMEIINDIREYDVAIAANKSFSEEYRNGVHKALNLAIRIVDDKIGRNAMR